MLKNNPMDRHLSLPIRALQVLLFLFWASAATAQSLNIPDFFTVDAKELSNTQGQWVRVNPEEPNNIDLVETRIFKMPEKGKGISRVEFKLVGGDGGTAHYNQTATVNYFANGGRGGDVNFALNLQNTGTHGQPFIVTFGKKGQSASVTNNFYVSAGGGGSTGMAWLKPIKPPGFEIQPPTNVNSVFFNRLWGSGASIWNLLIAVAGGGSGGFANLWRAVHGRSAWRVSTSTGIVSGSGAADVAVGSIVAVAAGGSSLRSSTGTLNQPIGQDYKLLTSGYVHNVFDFIGSARLYSMTYGQGGGQPILIKLFAGGGFVPGGLGGFSGGGAFNIEMISSARGGAGFSGGGAGAITTNQIFSLTESEMNNIPTSGAGGSGSESQIANANRNQTPGEDGWNVYSSRLENVSIIQNSSTNNPQSGYFMYRTITENEPPQINMSGMTVNLGNGNNSWMLYNPTVSFQQAIEPYLMKNTGIWDNDGIASVTASVNEFTCDMRGQTIPVDITVTDFAGNSTAGTIMVTVADPFTPVAVIPEPSPDIYDAEATYRIDVSSGPVVLTAANFPKGFDGCNGDNVEVLWLGHTYFDCSHVGNQTVEFIYIDSDQQYSPVYTKTFKVVQTQSARLYVDHTATGKNNGTSWTDAFTSLQTALSHGCISGNAGREIYVAQGTYRPDEATLIPPGDRSVSFALLAGDKLYGGFPSGGSVFANRDPEAYPTILSGEIGSPAKEDNSYHVVEIKGKNTHLEGFTVRDGYADAANGGGLMLRQTESFLSSNHTTTIRQVKFLNNHGVNGGAVYTEHQNMTYLNQLYFQNCFFEGNVASASGGAVYLNSHNGTANMRQQMVNCVLANNTAGVNGGAVYTAVLASNLTTINCTFAGNSAGSAGGGGAIYNQGQTYIRNSILWGNTPNQVGNTYSCQASYSNIQGLASASVQNEGNNMDTDPKFFVLPAFSLLPDSPLRNRGKNDYNTELSDYAGHARISQDTIDIGAYEVTTVLYVARDAPDGGDGTTWATAFNNLNDAIDASTFGFVQREIWIKEGTYRPDRNANKVPGGRANTFYINYGLQVYGGFAGTETSLMQRNIGQHATILSGDIGVENDASDNAYHVVTMNGYQARLDGLIIEGGNADGTGNTNGGGIYDVGYYPNQNSVIINCVLRNNNSSVNGGAVYINRQGASTMNFAQCLFYGNTSGRGAAVLVQSAAGATGVICNMYSCTAINNTSRIFNAPAFEANVVTQPGEAKIYSYNSLWLNNKPLSYINNGTVTGANNYIADDASHVEDPDNPAGPDNLIMTADDGFRLKKLSPAINYGDNANIYNTLGRDIAGQQRILQGKTDAGAYESPGCLGLTKLYVDAGAATADGDGSSWPLALRTLNEALDIANTCPVDSIFIAAGTYYPADPTVEVSRDASFEVWRPLKILGGYPSGGGARDVQANPVIFNGNINTPAREDNTIHIMRIAADTSGTTLIDGITFLNGNGSLGAGNTGFYIKNGKYFRRGDGSAIYNNASRLHVNDCRFISNFALAGGAVYLSGGYFLSTRCLYDGNMAAQGGGAIMAGGGAPSYITTMTLRDNVFVRDTATAGAGGAVMANYGITLAYTDVSNNIFVHNVGMNENTGGGALHIGAGKWNISNNTFYANRSVKGGGVSTSTNTHTDNVLANNSFWNNRNVYNAPDDFDVHEFNTIADNSTGLFPAYADTLNLLGPDGLWFTADDGLRLKKTSLLINQGNNAYAATTKDITGAERIQLGKVDIGAYESDSMVTRWYVSAGQDSIAADGTSWKAAFSRFEDGVAAAKPGDTVWVAKGIYSPAAGSSFAMKSGVLIYGGFAGTEQEQLQRDLSLGHNAILQGNGSSVIGNTGVSNGALLDGFVIRNGNAAAQGGGVRNTNTTAQFDNIVFTNNSAADGGAIANINSQATIRNAVFYGNQAIQNGGAIYDNASVTTALHTTFYGNSAQNGAALAQHDGSSFSMGNGISWNNTPGEWYSTGAASTLGITYSFLQGENSGTGNISGVDPKFSYAGNPAGPDGLWFTADDGLTATDKSGYLNKGDNTLSAALATDIAGAARIQHSVADMGAYENDVFSFCESIAGSDGSTLYVNAGVPSSGNGLSWEGAFKTLTEALETANNCGHIDRILIATGAYYPTGYREAEDRTRSFVIARNNLHLLGGFAGNDAEPRNTGKYPTVLSGNINDASLPGDNSFHVVTLHNAGEGVALDGLIIRDGMADGAAPHNRGGGIYNLNIAEVSISNTALENNTAEYGGGFYNQSGGTEFINVAVTGNTAIGGGGGFYNEAGNALFTNATFAGNTASATGSGAMGIASGTAQLDNSIVYGGITGSYSGQYSLIEGTGANDRRLDAPPLADVFKDPANRDYTLKAGSPAIDAGSNGLFPGLDNSTGDLAGNPRLIGNAIDMGAYEFDPEGGLPVRWISFEGRLSEQKQALLTWKTEEWQVSHYEIERSIDARIFSIAGTLPAGTTGSGSYSFTDPVRVSGTVYYRIRQVDQDGTFSYSRIIYLTPEARRGLFAWPNPVADRITVELGSEYAGSTVSLVNAAGVVLQRVTVTERIFSISLDGYAAGIYLLHTFDGKVMRLIKE